MSLFNKPVDDVDFDDLRDLLESGAVESVILEFKRECPAKDETLKKLSSFANTYGGYLVVGTEADNDGRLTSLRGVEPRNNFKQQVIQWCFDGITPPVHSFVSPPISAPDSGRVFYVIHTPMSAESPHFMNGRKGSYIRTDEFSQRWEPRLADSEELVALYRKRNTVSDRRTRLLSRAEERFEAYRTHEREENPLPAGQAGAVLAISVCPEYPGSPVADEAGLYAATAEVRLNWRQTHFPGRNGVFTQHETVLVPDPARRVSLFEATVWGSVFYATELDDVLGDVQGIHMYAMLGYILLFLKHAGALLRSFGIEGNLLIHARLSRVRGVPLLYTEFGNALVPGPTSPLDNEFSLEVPKLSSAFYEDTDQAAGEVVKRLFFALNWPAQANDDASLDRLVEAGYEYNFWRRGL